jgi:nitrogen-specific signal transduction histidine kinase
MSQPATTVRRDELQTMEKDAVGLAEQTIIPAASERNQGDIADSRLALEAKAAMIENSIAAVFAYDTEERLIYGNQAGLKLCGVDDLAELQGSGFPQVRTPGSQSASPLSAYLPRITYSEEVFLEVKPAKLLPCHVSANHLYDASGATILSYANILDFTEMNAYKARLESKNRELIAANNKAEFANRTKSEFLANMSHELRTPLNAVIGFSEMIHSESFGPCDERYRDYALDINQSGQHLLDLINDILDLSKVESGTNEIHDEKMDIREVIESVMTMVKGRAQKGGVKLQLEVPDHPPALRADSRKMKQILVNLLSNAVKFTSKSGAGKAAVTYFKSWIPVSVSRLTTSPKLWPLSSRSIVSSIGSMRELGLACRSPSPWSSCMVGPWTYKAGSVSARQSPCGFRKNALSRLLSRTISKARA